ncbi:MAG: hypothetical protein QTN59_13445 [Candidatus Electrothrix communis]|nr:MAG: hypothetical protein QTN59_13445 [Candidatus Electrothrix communis]
MPFFIVQWLMPPPLSLNIPHTANRVKHNTHIPPVVGNTADNHQDIQSWNRYVAPLHHEHPLSCRASCPRQCNVHCAVVMIPAVLMIGAGPEIRVLQLPIRGVDSSGLKNRIYSRRGGRLRRSSIIHDAL